jgi:hypothetical protein
MGEHKHKKHDKKSKSDRHDKKHKKKHSSSTKRQEKEIDYSDPSLWTEAEGTTEATPAEYLRSQQQQQQQQEQPAEEAQVYPKEQDARHGWMLDGSFDFGGMGTKKEREQDKPKPNPDEVNKKKNVLGY